MATTNIKTVQRVPVPEPMAHITTGGGQPDERDYDLDADTPDYEHHLIKAHAYAQRGGNICEMLDPAKVAEIGVKAVREWNMDSGSRKDWVENAKKYLDLAAQETNNEDAREPIWENAADVNYPILSTASGQFLARAEPELIKGDKVVGVKVFSPPARKPDPITAAKAGPQPQNDQQAQEAMQAIQAAKQQEDQANAVAVARNARAERIKHYLNWLIFYQMDDWEGESGLLLLQASIIGDGFKKVYMSESGLKSDFLSSTCLTVANDAKSIFTAPRITHEFEVYPYEIEERIRGGVYNDIQFPRVSEDPEAPRSFIEQHRLDDLDGDGLAEPYIATVDVETQQTLSIVPAYTPEDIIVDEDSGRIKRINRWIPFPHFVFLPDPRGRFYGQGLGALLDSITDSVDTAVNQLLDAGTAQIAGGGFIGAGVRLQGSGQGGTIFFRPGEYQTVGTAGQNLREAVWERTIPQPSAVTFQMLELLLAAAKDIASIKDVITGDAPSTAPVGTTLALQNQALQVFSSIYKRIYRGFRDEFRLMYQCLKRWGDDRERQQYLELTGGDFDEDFAGDGTDIQPVADPTVVSKMQKIAKMQTLLQLAESQVGMAAGMTQPGPAQALISDALDVLDVDRPERFIAEVPPNPEAIAKTQDMTAAAAEKQARAQKLGADAQTEAVKTAVEAQHTMAKTTGEHAKTLAVLADNSLTHHSMHQIADQIQQTGSLQPPPEEPPEGSPGQ